jgi:hypothetical protein
MQTTIADDKNELELELAQAAQTEHTEHDLEQVTAWIRTSMFEGM